MALWCRNSKNESSVELSWELRKFFVAPSLTLARLPAVGVAYVSTG